MINVHKNFVGGNIIVKSIESNTVTLENEIRDSMEDWFYWAFCVENAQGHTLTFRLQNTRLGYFGPAISHDLKTWHWLDCVDKNSFTYTFAEEETRVYFAHSFLYHPSHFLSFAKKHKLRVSELCKDAQGNSVPCVTFGNGKNHIILTARHHACESTGSYVLEGVLEQLLNSPIPNTTVFCVPFVDYNGVICGDQGKSRAPHDHNRDYPTEDSIYPVCQAIRDYATKNGCRYGFDFHSPWHIGGCNDQVFIVQNSFEKLNKLNHFGELLEQNISPDSLIYEHENDYPFGTGWNQEVASFSNFMKKLPKNELAFTFETTYFGTYENKVSKDKLIELGRCFAKTIKMYEEMTEK